MSHDVSKLPTQVESQITSHAHLELERNRMVFTDFHCILLFVSLCFAWRKSSRGQNFPFSARWTGLRSLPCLVTNYDVHCTGTTVNHSQLANYRGLNRKRQRDEMALQAIVRIDLVEDLLFLAMTCNDNLISLWHGLTWLWRIKHDKGQQAFDQRYHWNQLNRWNYRNVPKTSWNWRWLPWEKVFLTLF